MGSKELGVAAGGHGDVTTSAGCIQAPPAFAIRESRAIVERADAMDLRLEPQDAVIAARAELSKRLSS